jgi:F-type H+-transporting ATPase subunit epsilon
MKFQIITPERVVFADEVDQVSLMTTTGEITVMAHHIPLVTVLKPGELRFKKQGEEKSIAVSGGFAEVKSDNSLVILADTAEHATEIDVARAEAARDRALKTMEAGVREDKEEFATIQGGLEKALLRLKVGNKYRRLP